MSQAYSGKRQNDDEFKNSSPPAPDQKGHYNKREEKDLQRDSTRQESGSAHVSKSKLDGEFSKFPDVTPQTITQLQTKGITSLFPIQQHCFQHIFAGDDLIARDLTGSGKTLGFALPVVERLRKQRLLGSRQVQAIVLAPTRELACQVSNTFQYLKHDPNEFRCSTVYGGVPIDPQIRDLKNGIEIFVGTTGRVLDHIERGNIDFSSIKTIVLDEADQMLKLGFKEDIEKILNSVRKVQRQVQICLFSATVPNWIDEVARQHMRPCLKKVDLAVDLKNKTARKVQHLLINCPFQRRLPVLADILTCYGGQGKSIVFTQTKADANSLLLCNNIKQDVEVMHGDIAQNQREITLKRFREGKVRCLVATDVASRGLDIPSVDLVVQLEPPKEVETYIHRSGRTARAGASGVCVTFYNDKSQQWISNIESQAGISFNQIQPPSHNDVMKQTNKGMLQDLDVVSEDVLPMFEEAAKVLLDQYKGNPIAAISKALAFISGIHSQKGSKSRKDNQTTSFPPDPDYDDADGFQSGGRFGGGGSSGTRGRGSRGGRGGSGGGGSNNYGGSCGSYRQSQATQSYGQSYGQQQKPYDENRNSWSRPANYNPGRGGAGPAGSSSSGSDNRHHTPGGSSGGSNRPHYYNQDYSGNSQSDRNQKPTSHQQRQMQDYPVY